jgi:hypothetical protein
MTTTMLAVLAACVGVAAALVTPMPFHLDIGTTERPAVDFDGANDDICTFDAGTITLLKTTTAAPHADDFR